MPPTTPATTPAVAWSVAKRAIAGPNSIAPKMTSTTSTAIPRPSMTASWINHTSRLRPMFLRKSPKPPAMDSMMRLRLTTSSRRAYWLMMAKGRKTTTRSEEHTSELQSHRDLHSFPTRRSSDLEPEATRDGLHDAPPAHDQLPQGVLVDDGEGQEDYD